MNIESANERKILTERTSKPLKAHLALSSFLFWFALLSWFLPYGHSAQIADMPWSAVLMIAVALWYTVTKCLVWWHHE